MTEEIGAAPDVGQAEPDAGAVASWTDGFSDEMKGYVETKGFTDAGALANSYQNLEKLRGVPADQLLQLPADMSDLEAMAPVYAKMGRPDEAGGYTNTLKDGFDDATYQAISERAHQLGLGDGQFQGLQQIVQEQAIAIQEAETAASNEAFSTWKDGNPEGYQNAARVMATIGMDEAAVEGVLSGDKSAVYDMLAKVASRSAEGEVVHGQQPTSDTFSMSPEAAQAKINDLWQDDSFKKQYLHGTGQVKTDAMARMEKLHKIAATKKG